MSDPKYHKLTDLLAALASGELPSAKLPDTAPTDRPNYPDGGYGFERDSGEVAFRWWCNAALTEAENDHLMETADTVFSFSFSCKAVGIGTDSDFTTLLLTEMGIGGCIS